MQNISDLNGYKYSKPRAQGVIEVASAYLFSWYFFIALLNVLKLYAAVEWSVYGFRYNSVTLVEVIYLMIAIMLCSIAVPKRMDSPSSLFLIVSYVFIVLPAFVCLVAMDESAQNNHVPLIFSIAFAFSAACAFVSRAYRPTSAEARLPVKNLAVSLAVVAVILMGYLYYRYRDVMEFASLGELYIQRERGSADNLVDGYAQTYSQYVLSTGLVVFGLYKRNFIYIAIGLAGSIMNFAISAEKSGLMYPLFVIGLYFAVKSKNNMFTSLNFILISFGTILIFSIFTRDILPGSEFICWYLGTRTLLIPGAFVVHYSDFFNESGYTYLSHVRGLNYFLSVPPQYAGDPRWPSLGLMVGEDLIGIPKLNANASYLSSDGIASFGLIGCFIAFAILIAISRMFDFVARGVPKSIALPLLVPIALTLTNGSALSVLTSSGGFFWMILLRYAFDKPMQLCANSDRV